MFNPRVTRSYAQSLSEINSAVPKKLPQVLCGQK